MIVFGTFTLTLTTDFCGMIGTQSHSAYSLVSSGLFASAWMPSTFPVKTGRRENSLWLGTLCWRRSLYRLQSAILGCFSRGCGPRFNKIGFVIAHEEAALFYFVKRFPEKRAVTPFSATALHHLRIQPPGKEFRFVRRPYSRSHL